MSLTFSRILFYLRRSHNAITDRTLQKRCIHCSVYCRADDSFTGPGSDMSSQEFMVPSPKTRVVKKEENISLAMRIYLERKQKAEANLKEKLDEYNLGRRHLANIMGVEEHEMTPQTIKKAIAYLLPSGLTAKTARPMMENPEDLIPQIQAAGFDRAGRPNHYLFYTFKPRYFELMHKLAMALDDVREECVQDEAPDHQQKQEDFHDELMGTEWISYDKFREMFKGEKISDHDFNRFIVLLEAILEEPYAYQQRELFTQYKERIQSTSSTDDVKPPVADENGRYYQMAVGGKKCSKAKVVLREKGSGNVTINGQDITYFTHIVNRKQVLWPLQLCGLIDKFDIEATVNGSGGSAQAGAVRLGVARALMSFVSEDKIQAMRIAGLLTRDPRMRERKKAGQEKARKKFTWKRR